MLNFLNNQSNILSPAEVLEENKLFLKKSKKLKNINIGILSDNVGSGKTLNILSLIAICPISIPYFDDKEKCIKKICQHAILQKENFLKKKLITKLSHDVVNTIHKYFKRSDLPFRVDETVWETRLLTVFKKHRGSVVSGLLM